MLMIGYCLLDELLAILNVETALNRSPYTATAEVVDGGIVLTIVDSSSVDASYSIAKVEGNSRSTESACIDVSLVGRNSGYIARSVETYLISVYTEYEVVGLGCSLSKCDTSVSTNQSIALLHR